MYLIANIAYNNSKNFTFGILKYTQEDINQYNIKQKDKIMEQNKPRGQQ